MENKLQTVFAFIDGAYLSFISKHLGKDAYLKYKIEEVSVRLCRELNLWCKKIYYYTAPPYQSMEPTEEEKKRKKGYDSFIEKLKKSKIPITIREGRLIKIKDGEFIQKGVDTWLTLDLLLASQERKTDKILLITADSDFVPILNVIKQSYKTGAVIAYFTERQRKSKFLISGQLLRACDEKILIKREHFVQNDKHI